MAPTRISIDLVQSPLQIGGLVIGKYIVSPGSKAIKVNGEVAPTYQEVKQAMDDARTVVKSFFGSPSIDAAVLVLPNNTSDDRMDEVNGAAQGAGHNITQVIREYTAVAAAYLYKEKPTLLTTVIIISFSGNVIDVVVLDVSPVRPHEFISTNVEDFDYTHVVHFHSTHGEPIDFEKQNEGRESGPGNILGLVGSAIKSVVLGPIELALNILENFLSSDNLKGCPEPKHVIFVGKVSGLEKLRQPVKKRFPQAQEWAGDCDPVELAAYGAAVLSFKDKKIRLRAAGDDVKAGGDPSAVFSTDVRDFEPEFGDQPTV
ncbi:hypothetical protein AXF42_Ash011362 [Apostasia shenzhenica]|uniref:Uncharacterized protein n=1 Tax=Apostasia shenzhenica TaxID=1088818 RepID=A0A2I0AEB1_9ASPA|nr:hypothetical protein AXF42_Ash011362 [Apostasia shenzhenica]